jgi:uncharacterized membrane protein YdbT with pleckstrin-like domain
MTDPATTHIEQTDHHIPPHYEERPQMFRASPLAFLFHCMMIAVGFGLIVVGMWYFGAPLLFVGAGGLLIWYVATLANKLTVTPSSVRLERGILSKNYTEVRVSDIRTVEVQQGLLNRIMDTGRVLITTMGDRPEIIISGLPRPAEIEEMLRTQ